MGSVMAQIRQSLATIRQFWLGRLVTLLLAACCLASGGCAAMTNPVGQGIPVSRVPPEYLAQPVDNLKDIPLTTLRQSAPDAYRLASGDVLGVYIEGILGDKGQPLPVRFPEQGQTGLPPAIGYPIPVREDGTVPLPLLEPPLKVQGMTVAEAETAIRKAYLFPKKLLAEGKHVFVSLQRQRQYRVQVVRQDGPGGTVGGASGLAVFQRRNTGAVVELPAYENDILNALNRTGGLPGTEALDEVTVQRELKGGGTKVTHIPLKMHEGEPIPFGVQDIILENGDVVFVPGRFAEVFYTGGLLQPRQFVVPRDYDLHVVEAIALAGGPLVNGAINQNNLSGNITATGIGSPNPSRVTVLRRTKHDGLIPIIVDLNLAYKDTRENILIRGGDVIILQETVGESFTRWLIGATRLGFSDLFETSKHTAGTLNVTAP
jgi:protein involved in polysaccharide export with SLBB domain